jgi:hypothetical protein
MVRDSPSCPVCDPAAACSVSITRCQRRVLHNSHTIIFFLVAVMAVAAMYLAARSAAPLLRELRGEQQRQAFVPDFVAVVDAQHSVAPLEHVERQDAVVDSDAWFFFVMHREQVGQPAGAFLIVIAFGDNQIDFLMALQTDMPPVSG